MWNSGAAMWVRQPARSGIRDSSDTAASMPASLRGAPLGVPVVPEVRITIAGVAGGRLQVALVVRRHQLLEGVLGARVTLGPRQHAVVEVGARQQAGELLVVDHQSRRLALEHVDELGAGEGGVEVEDVGAQLGDRDRGVDEAAVVAAHHRHRVALPHAALGERAGQRVGAAVQLAPGQLAELVDHADLVRGAGREGGEAARRAGAPAHQHAAEVDQGARAVGPDHAGAPEDADGGAGARHRAASRRALTRASSARPAAWPASPC